MSDGCPLDCVSETLKHAGIERFDHLRVTDLGLEKGNTLIDEVSIKTVAAKGCELMNGASV